MQKLSIATVWLLFGVLTFGMLTTSGFKLSTIGMVIELGFAAAVVAHFVIIKLDR